METTIQISKKLLETLKKRKLSDRESYEKIIWDLIEDTRELSDLAKKEITEAREEIVKGKVHKWEDIKKEFKLNV